MIAPVVLAAIAFALPQPTSTPCTTSTAAPIAPTPSLGGYDKKAPVVPTPYVSSTVAPVVVPTSTPCTSTTAAPIAPTPSLGGYDNKAPVIPTAAPIPTASLGGYENKAPVVPTPTYDAVKPIATTPCESTTAAPVAPTPSLGGYDDKAPVIPTGGLYGTTEAVAPFATETAYNIYSSAESMSFSFAAILAAVIAL